MMVMAYYHGDGYNGDYHGDGNAYITIELGGIPVLVVTKGIDFIPEYRYTVFKH